MDRSANDPRPSDGRSLTGDRCRLGVLIGADHHQVLAGLTTAAGTAAPAGSCRRGVAGLRRRDGAAARRWRRIDVVRRCRAGSLAQRRSSISASSEETEGGYARELTPEGSNVSSRLSGGSRLRPGDHDAAIPGRPAPRLIPASAVAQMRPGSVIVDLAAETGGNCELTKPGEIVDSNGVKIIGLLNLPSMMATHASQLYSRNVSALLELLAPGGELSLDWDDEIIAGTCVTRPEAS
jgi:NAD(P) transhydrogenase subunit alpha